MSSSTSDQTQIHLVSSVKTFGGEQRRYTHFSACCQCSMTFSVFVPPLPSTSSDADAVKRGSGAAVSLPVIMYLSGLTCSDENASTKSGVQRLASSNTIAIVFADTSPRGVSLPGEDDAYDFGSGASFYINATVAPFSKHYMMEEYITKELPALIQYMNMNNSNGGDGKAGESSFGSGIELNVHGNCSLMGHSMGGHGALTLGMKYSELYKSVSAFSPIVSLLSCPWGLKALRGYLGDDEHVQKTVWPEFDAVSLIKKKQMRSRIESLPILIDQGTSDSFLENQLKTELLISAVNEEGFDNFEIRMQEGYDHSYYFIASFIEDHIKFHAKYLL